MNFKLNAIKYIYMCRYSSLTYIMLFYSCKFNNIPCKLHSDLKYIYSNMSI